MKCTVCNHPQQHDIDLALLSGRQTLKSLQQQYGPGKSSLFRHRKHLVAKLRRSREDLESNRQQVSLLKLNAFLDHVQRGVEAAAADGDLDRVFKGSHIGSRLIHQINHLDVPLELDTVYRLISSPGFISQDSFLPTSPQIITDLHRALVDQAFFPCPDPPPEIVAADDADDKNDHDTLDAAEADDDGGQEADDYSALAAAEEAAAADISADSFLKTRNPQLETQQAQLEALRLLQSHFPDLDLTDATVSPAEKDPQPERDASATLPRQTDPYTKNINEIKQDSFYTKNYPKHSNVGRESEAHPAILASEEPVGNFACEAYPAAAAALVPSSLIPDPWLSETEHQEPGTDTETAFCPLPSANCLCGPLPSAKCPYDEPTPSENPAPDNSQAEPAPAEPDLALLLSNSADDLFEITHGYKRNNPPKHIPYRHRDEDFRSTSIFGDPRKIFG